MKIYVWVMDIRYAGWSPYLLSYVEGYFYLASTLHGTAIPLGTIKRSPLSVIWGQ